MAMKSRMALSSYVQINNTTILQNEKRARAIQTKTR